LVHLVGFIIKKYSRSLHAPRLRMAQRAAKYAG